MTRTVTRIGRATWRWASMPATLAHELTHFLLALPWAEESAIISDEEGIIHGVTWTDDAPQWAIWLASLGPTFLGAVVGAVGLWQLASHPPASLNDWLLAATVAAYWVIYAAPSSDDLNIHRHQEQ